MSDLKFHRVMATARQRLGLSIRELARETGLSPTTIQLAENGSDVRLSTMLAISKFLGLVVDINGCELVESDHGSDGSGAASLDLVFEVEVLLVVVRRVVAFDVVKLSHLFLKGHLRNEGVYRFRGIHGLEQA